MTSPLRQPGFTLIEILVVVSIIGILAVSVTVVGSSLRDDARFTTAAQDMGDIAKAAAAYVIDHGTYPADADGGIPAELLPYLGGNEPTPPWDNAYYDWDFWQPPLGPAPTAQVSMRFSSDIPDHDWTTGFTSSNHAVIYCVEGPCRSLGNTTFFPQNYPGYCVNCDCKQLANLTEQPAGSGNWQCTE